MTRAHEQMDDQDAAVARAIGEEIRRARESVGWTRAELVARMPSDIHPQTLATYERGIRQCTVGRLVEICRTMGMSAPDVLSWAMQRAEIDLVTIGLQVDLRAVLADSRVELLPLRRWARGRLTDDPGAYIAHLEWPVVQEMAALFGIPRPEFVSDLIMFTPRAAPRWPGPDRPRGGRAR